MKRKTIHLVVACTLVLGSMACEINDPTTQVQYFPLIFTDFNAAQPLQVSSPGTEVFKDQATWDAFWLQHAPLAGPAPVLDFSENILIAVFWGAQGTGCFNFVDAILNVRTRVDGLNTLPVVEVAVLALPDLGNCATPVNPFQVVTVETTIAVVDFVGEVPN